MNIFVIFVCLFLSISYFYIYYNLYIDKKYEITLQIFVALNVLFSAYAVYMNALNANTNIQNTNIDVYTKLMESSFSTVLDEFRMNPHMKYLFDEMYNNIQMPKDHKRDVFHEQLIVYRIMINISNYCVYYYSHKDIEGYDVLLKSQNKKVIEYFIKYNRSNIFYNHLITYLKDFAGERTIYFFKEYILKNK